MLQIHLLPPREFSESPSICFLIVNRLAIDKHNVGTCTTIRSWHELYTRCRNQSTRWFFNITSFLIDATIKVSYTWYNVDERLLIFMRYIAFGACSTRLNLHWLCVSGKCVKVWLFSQQIGDIRHDRIDCCECSRVYYDLTALRHSTDHLCQLHRL